MPTIRRILVAIKNPYARSFPVLEKAVQLARALDAHLELFHAIAAPVYVDFELVDEALSDLESTRRRQYRDRLETIASRVREQGVAVTTNAECDFPAHEAILRRAQRMNAGLIMAEAHAGRHRMPWLLQLTDFELLRHSPVPVLLVKNRRPYEHPVVLAAVDPAHAFAKPSKLDDDILAAGSTFSTALRGTLHAVHAYVPVPSDAKPSELLKEDATERLDARARTKARARLDGLLRKADLPRVRKHLVAQHPINAIPDLARKLDCSIVVMGAISRSGLKRLFIGNTAERMLDSITCDILVVKPRQFVSHVRRGRRIHLVPTHMPLPY